MEFCQIRSGILGLSLLRFLGSRLRRSLTGFAGDLAPLFSSHGLEARFSSALAQLRKIL